MDKTALFEKKKVVAKVLTLKLLTNYVGDKQTCGNCLTVSLPDYTDPVWNKVAAASYSGNTYLHREVVRRDRSIEVGRLIY